LEKHFFSGNITSGSTSTSMSSEAVLILIGIVTISCTENSFTLKSGLNIAAYTAHPLESASSGFKVLLTLSKLKALAIALYTHGIRVPPPKISTECTD